jgi:hypothetical protein
MMYGISGESTPPEYAHLGMSPAVTRGRARGSRTTVLLLVQNHGRLPQRREKQRGSVSQGKQKVELHSRLLRMHQ